MNPPCTLAPASLGSFATMTFRCFPSPPAVMIHFLFPFIFFQTKNQALLFGVDAGVTQSIAT